MSEGYIANLVPHPGILRIFDDGMTEDSCPYLAMEMLRGETLEERWRAAGLRLDPDAVISLMIGVLGVLSAVHAAGVVHGDLKPSNVFLTHQNEIRVLDFGVAKVAQTSARRRLSVEGVVLGTPAFMAPEQAAGKRGEVDARTDVFAVGAILFTLLSGEDVHPVEGVQNKVIAAATTAARPISSALPALPGDLAVVIDRALQFRREARWPTIDAMRSALVAAYASADSLASTEPLAPSSDRHDPPRELAPASRPREHGLSTASHEVAPPAHAPPPALMVYRTPAYGTPSYPPRAPLPPPSAHAADEAPIVAVTPLAEEARVRAALEPPEPEPAPPAPLPPLGPGGLLEDPFARQRVPSVILTGERLRDAMLDEDESFIVSLVDGTATLAAITEVSGGGAADVAEVIEGLRIAGVLSLR